MNAASYIYYTLCSLPHNNSQEEWFHFGSIQGDPETLIDEMILNIKFFYLLIN